MMRTALLILPLLLLLVFAIGATVADWDMTGGVQMGWQAYVPMALGILLTLALAATLVGLLIYSNRHGHDRPWTP